MSDDPRRQQVSVRLPVRLKAEIEREAAEYGVSRSEYIRNILADRHDADRLRDRLDAREQRVAQLEKELARRSQVEEKVDTLARRVEDRDDAPPWPVRWVRWFRDRGES